VRLYFALLLIVYASNTFSSDTQIKLLETGYRADFKLYASGFLVASSSRQLIKQPEGMEYRTYTTPEGIAKWYTSDTLVELSQFKINKNQVSARTYRYHQSGDEQEKIVNIEFDQTQKKVRLSTEKKMHPLHPESYDALSFQIALMQKLTQGEKSLVIDIADQNGMFSYHAQVGEIEQIQTDIGMLNTQKVQMTNITNGNLFTFWCATKYNYLPVRIRLERQESGIDSILEITAFHHPMTLP